MSSSNNNPGLKDVNDLKARLGMNKPAPQTPAQPGGFGTTPPAPGGFGAPSKPSAGFGAAASPFGDAAKFGVPSAESEPEEEEDYNYEQVDKPYDYDPNLFDPDVKLPQSKGKYTVYVIIGLGVFLFGIVIGYIWTNVIKDRESVNRRIGVAQNVERSVKPKVEGFVRYMTHYKQRSTSKGKKALEFDKKFHDEIIRAYNSYDFMLDMANDVSAESIILGQSTKHNPLSKIREYSAGTMLLVTLISNHIAETSADMQEIENLLEGNDAVDTDITYAVYFNIDELIGFAEGASRSNYALASQGIYQVKRALTDDEDASQAWGKMKQSMTQDHIRMLTHVPDPKNDDTGGLDLPKRLIYEIQQRGSTPKFVFSDEILIIDRSALLGSSANALDRYKNRMTAIFQTMELIEKVCDSLLEDLHAQATEEKI